MSFAPIITSLGWVVYSAFKLLNWQGSYDIEALGLLLVLIGSAGFILRKMGGKHD